MIQHTQPFRWLVLISLILPLLMVSPAAAEDGMAAGKIYAAFQSYENGYMVWRSDTGGIWVFGNNGWLATYYPEASYKNLPDNPITDPTPAGLTRPVSGFGRVWGNFADVRQALGWAVAAEIGYEAWFEAYGYSPGGLTQTRVTLPVRLSLLIRSDGTWGYPGQVRPVASLRSGTTMPITWQAFETGYLMYWPETGSIWALYLPSGQTQYFDSTAYGALTDNPVTDIPPAGRLKPLFGFGKVWGHFPSVRARLGWAINHETGYTTRFERLAPVSGAAYLSVQDPTGRTVILRDNGTWYFN
jgi:hypothetical protein